MDQNYTVKMVGDKICEKNGQEDSRNDDSRKTKSTIKT